MRPEPCPLLAVGSRQTGWEASSTYRVSVKEKEKVLDVIQFGGSEEDTRRGPSALHGEGLLKRVLNWSLLARCGNGAAGFRSLPCSRYLGAEG